MAIIFYDIIGILVTWQSHTHVFMPTSVHNTCEVKMIKRNGLLLFFFIKACKYE